MPLYCFCFCYCFYSLADVPPCFCYLAIVPPCYCYLVDVPLCYTLLVALPHLLSAYNVRFLMFNICCSTNLQVAEAPPGTQACSFNIEGFHRTNPVVPDHKPWLVVQGMNDGFYVDHVHPFGASLASSNAGMVGNAIVDIWISERVGPIAKYEDDFSVYCSPVLDGPFVDGNYHYAYDKDEAVSRIASLCVPWHKEKGDPHFFFHTHLH